MLTCDEQDEEFEFFISGGSNGDLGGALVFREFSDDPWYQVGIRTVPQGNNKRKITKLQKFRKLIL